MGSEKEGTGCEQPESHRLCANGCGFFGTAATLNLCSKCYRDFRIKEDQAASAKAAVEKSLNPSASSASLTKTREQSICASVDSASSSAAVSTPSESTGVSVQSESSVKNRCLSCNKRVGLTAFKCRCGSTFCGTHRYPEKHDCSFDYKKVGREAIAKANPVCKAAKLEMI